MFDVGLGPLTDSRQELAYTFLQRGRTYACTGAGRSGHAGLSRAQHCRIHPDRAAMQHAKTDANKSQLRRLLRVTPRRGLKQDRQPAGGHVVSSARVCDTTAGSSAASRARARARAPASNPRVIPTASDQIIRGTGETASLAQAAEIKKKKKPSPCSVIYCRFGCPDAGITQLRCVAQRSSITYPALVHSGYLDR